MNIMKKVLSNRIKRISKLKNILDKAYTPNWSR